MGDGGTGEKTEEPTPQKLRQAREKGQIAKSQDIVQALGFVATFAVLGLTMGYLGQQLMDFFRSALDAGTRKGDLATVVTTATDAPASWKDAMIVPALRNFGSFIMTSSSASRWSGA